MTSAQATGGILAFCALATSIPGCRSTELSGPTFELVDVSPDEFCDELRTLHPNWVSSRYLGQDDTYHYASNYFRTTVMRVEVDAVDRERIVDALLEKMLRWDERMATHPNEMGLQSGFSCDGYREWTNSVELDESLRDEANLRHEAVLEQTRR